MTSNRPPSRVSESFRNAARSVLPRPRRHRRELWTVTIVCFCLFAWDSTILLTPASSAQPPREDDQGNWPTWRGPSTNGGSDRATPPIRWSENENVVWKTELRGLGHSTPVVWGDRIFLTAATPFGEKFAPIADGAPGSHDNLKVEQKHRFLVAAYDRKTGKELWQKTLNEAIPHEGSHYTASLASHSPVTDGRHLVVSFGSHGLYCLDLEGELLWKRDLGRMSTKHGHGEGSSPALSNQTLLINWDHEGDSRIIALDVATGEERWRSARDEVTSWSSPLIVKQGNQHQVVVSGTGKVRSYDLQTGEVIWECGGLSHNVVASPVADQGIVVVGSSYEIRKLLAIQLEGAHGDLTGSEHVLWSRDRGTPYVPSPLIYDGHVYYLSHYQGILSRVELATGDEPTGPFRLPGVRDVYASLTGADGRIYVADRDGLTTVISATEVPRILARNLLDDRFSATPAVVGDELILRGERFLYLLREE